MNKLLAQLKCKVRLKVLDAKVKELSRKVSDHRFVNNVERNILKPLLNDLVELKELQIQAHEEYAKLFSKGKNANNSN